VSVKILGGEAKGFSVDIVREDLLRPTSVLLKRRFFDSFQRFDSLNFVDLCAGSGAVGLEAFSRGASSLYLIEYQRDIYRQLEKTVVRFCKNYPIGQNNIHTLKCSALDWIKQTTTDEQNCLNRFLFFDPPYEKKDLYQQFCYWARDHMGAWKYLLIESEDLKSWGQGPIVEFLQLEPKKVYRQGKSFLLFFENSEGL
jgi:16S rRNA (guanine966-N2)-methyltransferase